MGLMRPGSAQDHRMRQAVSPGHRMRAARPVRTASVCSAQERGQRGQHIWVVNVDLPPVAGSSAMEDRTQATQLLPVLRCCAPVGFAADVHELLADNGNCFWG